MGNYRKQWHQYRRLWIYSFVILLAFVPVGVLAIEGSARLFHTESWGFVVVILWAIFWIFSGFRVCAWRCPQCGKVYIGKWWFGNAFLFRKCAYCGLPKYADK